MAAELKPVAWRFKERVNGDFDSDWILTKYEPADGVRIIAKEPLYTAPGVNPSGESSNKPVTEGYMEAFYEMAAMLGIEGAQAASPEQVYAEQVKPALERLKQRAKDAEEAYLNMRAWAEQNGLDTTARNVDVNGMEALATATGKLLKRIDAEDAAGTSGAALSGGEVKRFCADCRTKDECKVFGCDSAA